MIRYRFDHVKNTAIFWILKVDSESRFFSAIKSVASIDHKWNNEKKGRKKKRSCGDNFGIALEKETNEYVIKSCLGLRSNTAPLICHSCLYPTVFDIEQNPPCYPLGTWAVPYSSHFLSTHCCLDLGARQGVPVWNCQTGCFCFVWLWKKKERSTIVEKFLLS